MKRVLLLLAVLLFSAGTMMAQQDKAAEKAAKKAEKEAKKAAEAAEQMALFEQGVQALKEKDFVLEAERVEFKRGQFVYVTPSTNFVSMKGDRATIQLAFNTAAAGPNGIGGITVDGSASNIEMKTDKKGNVTFSMMVQGVAVRQCDNPYGKRHEQVYGNCESELQQQPYFVYRLSVSVGSVQRV